MVYGAARSACSWRSCSPDPWQALRHGIRPIVPPMNAYPMSSIGCNYIGAFAHFIDNLRDNLEPLDHRHDVVLFGFISAPSSTSVEADIFTFIFATKGL